MAKLWYPVIDYLECIECGSCVAKCTHGVYDKVKAPTPVVLHPDGCVDHCHGCGELCPQGAITYIGEDSGWKPPHGKPSEEAPCCGCGSSEYVSPEKTLAIDFLYLDLATCDRCKGTDTALLEAIDEVRTVLQAAGYLVTLNKVEISEERLAEQYRFLSSPTIRINGQDICLAVKESPCGPCSQISNQSVDCRIFVYEGKEYEIPPKAMLIDAMLRTVYGQAQVPVPAEPYRLPENLKHFFAGKASGSCCC